MWWEAYKDLDLLGGHIHFICDDDEDMIEILYDDSMMIAVGKLVCNGLYYITVVASDDVDGWKKPVAEITFGDKRELYNRIQSTIFQYRG